MNPDCPLCTATGRMVEGPLYDGGYFCNCCGDVFVQDATGRLMRRESTQHSIRGASSFGQALKKALGPNDA